MRRRLAFNVAIYTSPEPTSPQFIADLDRCVALKAWGIRMDICPCYTFNGDDLSDPSAKIAAARSRGLKVNAMIPHWTTDDKKQHLGNASALGDFAAKLVAEFGSDIASWELGNEPNISIPFCGGTSVNPEYQAEVSTAFVANLPTGAHIISPGLAPASDNYDSNNHKWTSMSPVTFAKRYWAALDLATANKIQGMGIHLYGSPKDADQPWSTYGQLPKIVAASGGRTQEVTEFNGYLNSSRSMKATEVKAALPWLRDTSLPIGRIFHYDMSTQSQEFAAHYGVYEANGKPNPLLSVYQNWVATRDWRDPGGGTPTDSPDASNFATPGVFDADDPENP